MMKESQTWQESEGERVRGSSFCLTCEQEAPDALQQERLDTEPLPHQVQEALMPRVELKRSLATWEGGREGGRAHTRTDPRLGRGDSRSLAARAPYPCNLGQTQNRTIAECRTLKY
eukprot:TRINITY_DN26612_c0_g1_i1.p1 TRINITY_DN26612_c0_g1~~TRINITY_DN26612_c0_g1_i1.p1  ORF type:complete len:116 (-),score=6.51 TRINITY_DN26612_c0_g1_i1:87-434(-)